MPPTSAYPSSPDPQATLPAHRSGARADVAAPAIDLSTLLPPAGQLVGGHFVPATSGAVRGVGSPFLAEPLGTVPDSDARDVEQAAQAARGAFQSGHWSRAAAADRKRVLLALADRMAAQAERLALLETLETGRPLREARQLDVAQSIARLRWYGELADKCYGATAPEVPDRLGLVTRVPVGVVAAVVPWNFPLLMAVTKIAPALAAGNCVILKPAESSSLTALVLGQLALEAGLPEGVLQVLTGAGTVCGQALAESPVIDALAFTGSTPTGMRILAAAAPTMKRVSLECGGKSPHLVLDPACVDDDMIDQVAWGGCYHQGQVCDAGSNLLLVGDGHDEWLHRLKQRLERFTLGHPFDDEADLAGMISAAHLRRVDAFVHRALEQGARVMTGASAAADVAGACYRPTLLDGVAPGSEIFREEVFGPVLSACRVRTADEAVALVNGARYGLAATVWGSGLGQAAAVASRLRAGVVAVNTGELGNVTTPFGGFRQSGLGRDRGLEAMDNYTEVKTTWMRLPAWMPGKEPA